MEEEKKNQTPETEPTTEPETDAAFEAEEAAEQTRKAALKAAHAENRKVRKTNLKQKLHSKRFRYGSYSTILVAVVVVLALLVNIGMVVLVDQYPSLKLDLTNDGRYQISDKLSDILENLENDTEIILCANKETFETKYNDTIGNVIGGDSTYEGTRIVEMMSKAGEASDKLKVSFLDLESNPNLKAEYGDLIATDIIVRTEKRSKVLALEDFYEASNENAQGQTTTTTTYVSYFEYQMGNALVNVNSENVPMVAFTTGHGETTPEYLTDLLQDNCFDTMELNLVTTPEIPEEVDTVVINAPESDFSLEQIELLDEFLLNGEAYGKSLVIMLSPTMDNAENLNALMSDWGYEMGQVGSYIQESDTDHYVYTPLYLVAEAKEDTIFSNINSAAFLSYAPMQIDELWTNSHGNMTAEVLLETYDTAYVTPGDVEDKDHYAPNNADYGAFPLVTLTTMKHQSGADTASSYVSIVTSSQMFNELTSLSGSGNADCALALFQEITGTSGNNYSVYIKGLTFSGSDLVMTSTQQIVIGITLFTILIPLAVLIAGLVIWLRRRHL